MPCHWQPFVPDTMMDEDDGRKASTVVCNPSSFYDGAQWRAADLGHWSIRENAGPNCYIMGHLKTFAGCTEVFCGPNIQIAPITSPASVIPTRGIYIAVVNSSHFCDIHLKVYHKSQGSSED